MVSNFVRCEVKTAQVQNENNKVFHNTVLTFVFVSPLVCLYLIRKIQCETYLSLIPCFVL